MFEELRELLAAEQFVNVEVKNSIERWFYILWKEKTHGFLMENRMRKRWRNLQRITVHSLMQARQSVNV